MPKHENARFSRTLASWLASFDRFTTCHIPGVTLEPGLRLSADLDPGRGLGGLSRPAITGGGGHREFGLSGAVLLMKMAEK